MAGTTLWMHTASAVPSFIVGMPARRVSAMRRSSKVTLITAPRAAEPSRSSSTSTQERDTNDKTPKPADRRDESGSSSSSSGGGIYNVRPDQRLAVFGASLGLPLRFGSGAVVKGYKLESLPESEATEDKYYVEFAGRKYVERAYPGPRPEKPIELYEFQGCPFCRKVREIVSILDIDVLFYPTPKNGPNFRPKAVELGGKSQFPYMVDPNTGVSMYESDDIIKYLVDKYGDGQVPVPLKLGFLTTITASLALAARGGKGSNYVPSRLPEKPLELWAYEQSPFCKIASEAFSELEIPHIYHSCARGSSKRDELKQKTGKFQVPYMEDPNTGVKLFESAAIVEYLKSTYALPQP
jgi:glutathione S-transferase